MWTVGVFSVLLVAVGVAGFVIPPRAALTSGAPAYNVFHLVFAAVGLATLATGSHAAGRVFLVGFGVIDLYQALASRQNWFPKSHFRWKRADDILHVVIGAALVAIGLIAT